MATTVHIPRNLLKALDRRAKALGVSRNSLIVQAIERDLGLHTGWPAGFFESIASAADDELKSTIDETMQAVKSMRRSKKPVDL